MVDDVDCAKVFPTSAPTEVELLCWLVEVVVVASRVVDDEEITAVVVLSTVVVDVLVRARASRTGCVAFGWRPRITALLSESGIFCSATTTKAMATRRSAMTAPIKGQRSGVGL